MFVGADILDLSRQYAPRRPVYPPRGDSGSSGDVRVEAYPDDKYLPSYLLLARHEEEAFRVLFAVDVEGDNVRLCDIVSSGSRRVAARSQDKETAPMRCTVWGAELRPTRTDLPFKVGDTRIVILKNLPVVQCGNCPEYLLEDGVLRRVDEILAGVERGAELEIIRYAA